MIQVSSATDTFAQVIAEQIADLIKVILRPDRPQDLHFAEGARQFKMFSSAEENVSFALADEEVESFSKLIDHLAKARRWKNLLSAKYVENRIEKVLYKSLSGIRDAKDGDVFPTTLDDQGIEIVHARLTRCSLILIKNLQKSGRFMFH